MAEHRDTLAPVYREAADKLLLTGQIAGDPRTVLDLLADAMFEAWRLGVAEGSQVAIDTLRGGRLR